MPPVPPATPRQGWLESLRGIAALQVLLLHLLGAFWLPAVTGEGPGGWLARSPLAFLWDGESAVWLFFLLSGVVLADAFARQLDAPAAALAARLLRLGLPAAASCLLAFVTFHAFPGAHDAAAGLLGPSWLGGNWAGDGSLASLLWEAGPAVLLTGFLPDAAPLPSIASAYNGPLWTLAVELRGSALVFALLAARRRWPGGWGVLAAALLGLLWRTPYAGFLLGALAALAAPRLRGLPCRPVLALLAGAAAGWLGGLSLQGLPEPAWLPSSGPAWWPALPANDLLREAQAALGLLALALLPAVPRWLDRPWLGALGQLSFPIYLVHWPMILGPGAALAVALAPLLGLGVARAAGAAVAALLSLLLAIAFRPVDAAAMRWARQVRRALAGGAPGGQRRRIPGCAPAREA